MKKYVKKSIKKSNRSLNTSKKLLNQNEITNIKTILDFLFYDNKKYYVSYQRFEECFSFIRLYLSNANLFEIFKEIIGKNHKYLTAQRFINKYIETKNPKANSQISFELRNFFLFLINSLVKDWNEEFVGIQTITNNCNIYNSSINFANRKLTNLILLTKKNDSIKKHPIIDGFKLKYNNNFDCNLYIENSPDELYQSLNINLDYISKINNYDKITHVYGCYTNKINYIGFKCLSGIMYNFGEQIGTPFIFGDYGKELHGFKTKIDKTNGIIMIETFFIDSDYQNNNINKIFNDVILINNANNNNNLLEDELIFEEKFFNDEINDDIIQINIVNDYNKNNEKYNEYEFIENNYLSNNKKELNKLKNDILQEIENENVMNKSKISMNSYSSQIVKHQAKLQDISKNSRNDFIDDYDNPKTSASRSKSINSKITLSEIIEKLKESIKQEIYNERIKFNYENYPEFFFYNNELLPLSISFKKNINYNKFQKIKDIFETFEKKPEKIIENHIFDMNTNYNYPKLKYDLKHSLNNWHILFDKLLSINKILICFVALIFNKIANSIDYNNKNNLNISLKDKIIFYKILIKYFNNKLNILNKKIFMILHLKKQEKVLINKEQDDNENSYDDDELKKFDFYTICEKLNIINNMFTNDTNSYEELAPIYNKYLTIQRKIIQLVDNAHEKNILKVFQNKNGEIKKNNKKTKANLILKNIKDNININNFKIYKKQEINKNKNNFTDNIFEPTKKNYGIKKINSINIAKIEEIINTSDYNVLPNKEDFFLNKITIQKGINTNNNFVLIISALIKYPSIIYKLFPCIQRTKNGMYCVNLRINGIWKLILIDDYIPYFLDRQKNKLIAFSSLKENYIWLVLLEKALSKLFGGYNKIFEINDIFNLLTDAIIEKNELIFFSKNNLINKLKTDLNINKYIVIVTTTNSIKCYDIGLLPLESYIIKEIKSINNKDNKIEYILKLKNNFNNILYNGELNNHELDTELNEIQEIEGEFYISMNELMNYFYLIYINKIHPIENGKEYFKEYIHYTKNEINFPNIAIIDVTNDTNIVIQFNKKKDIPCISYLIISDIDCEYVDSIYSLENSYSIELSLNQGKYFLLSDISYRYLFYDKNNFHGYTINTFSDDKINILKIDEINLNIDLNNKKIISNIIISFCNKNLLGKKHDLDLYIYEQNLKYSKKFPFTFIYFDNSNSNFDKILNLELLNQLDTKNYKNADYVFYLDYENLNKIQNFEIKDKILQKSGKLIMVMKLSEDFNFKLKYNVSENFTEDQLIQYAKNYGVVEELDENGKIKQYLIEYFSYLIVLIENEYEKMDFKMKLILKGLICLNVNDYEDDTVYFDLNEKETKLFRLKINTNNTEIVSFQFQFDD